jgi:hypothetical protein
MARAASSYRAARRNAARGQVWEGIASKYVPRAPVRPNVSMRWFRATPLERWVGRKKVEAR